jgi:Flp pilus assembly pilin Flp
MPLPHNQPMLETMLKKLWRDQRGQDMTEYALIAAFVSAAVMALSPAVLAVALYLGRSMHIINSALAQVGQ